MICNTTIILLLLLFFLITVIFPLIIFSKSFSKFENDLICNLRNHGYTEEEINNKLIKLRRMRIKV